MKVKIANQEIRRYLKIENPQFPKYAAPLINLINRHAQATRPKIVGQMSNLIQEFPGKTLTEWENWYLKAKPDAIQKATKKIVEKTEELRKVLGEIDRKIIEVWVKDLVIVKTFLGLKFQEAILQKGAEIKNTSHRLANSKDESRGIDGYIGEIPLTIKPDTYQLKAMLTEDLPVKIIYYKKIKGGIEVDYGNILS